jgi:signal transduction histidine kinase
MPPGGLLDAIPDGAMLWDRDLRLVAWNPAFESLFPDLRGILQAGMTAAAFVTATIERLAPEIDPARRAQLAARRVTLLRACDDTSWEFPLDTHRSITVCDRAIEGGGALSLYRDMTEVKRAAQRSLGSDAVFKAAIDAMPDGVIVLDQNDKLVAWNHAYVAMVPHVMEVARPGISFRSLVDASVRACSPDASEAEIAAQVARRLANHGRSNAPVEFEYPDSGVIIEATEHRTPDAGTVVVFRDVTARRQTQRAQRAFEARFRDGIECMADGLTLWDADDRLLAWNRRYTEMFTDRLDLLRVGISFAAFSSEILRRRHRDAGEQVTLDFITERVRRHREASGAWDNSMPDGRIIEIIEKPTSDGGRVALHRDVTSQRREQAALMRLLATERDLNAQQRRFVSIASHEFRTPLAIIDGATQRISTRLADDCPPDVAQRLERIRGAVARMAEIIDLTLSSAQLDDGQLKLTPELVDIATILRDAIERQRTINAKVEISLSQTQSPLWVACDPKLIDRVIANLISNAVKYSGLGRRVRVSLSATAAAVELAVSDDGVGIPADEIPQLFTRFFRARTASGIQGTGIGLHLAKEIVAMHGGTIAVASTVGRGSTFSVCLPLRLPSARPADLAPSRHDAA